MGFGRVDGGEDAAAHKAQHYYARIHIQIVDPHPGIHYEVTHAVFGTEGFGEEQDRYRGAQGQADGGQNLGQ